MADGEGEEMFPLEEGVWGKRGSPIQRLCPKDLSGCLWVALCERFRLGGVGRIASASNLVFVRGPEDSTS